MAAYVIADLTITDLELAVRAPTAGNNQGWHFIIVTDPAERQALVCDNPLTFLSADQERYAHISGPKPSEQRDRRRRNGAERRWCKRGR